MTACNKWEYTVSNMKGLIVHRLCTLCTHHHSGKNPLLPMQLRFCKPLINIYFKTLLLHRLTVSLMWLFSNKQQSLLTCNASMPLRYTVVPGCSYVSKKNQLSICVHSAVEMPFKWLTAVAYPWWFSRTLQAGSTLKVHWSWKASCVQNWCYHQHNRCRRLFHL